MKNYIYIDGYNMLYRARYSGAHSYNKSPWAITFVFFRSLRFIVEKLKADQIYFVLEGVPKQRLAMDADYKGTRTYEVDENYNRQRRIIIDIMKNHMPVHVVQHPDYECDDVLAHLVNSAPEDVMCHVVSTDTDFIQLYNTRENVKIFNPISKKVVERPDYDYVSWKAFVGDKADNIEGFRGIGKKRAIALVESAEKRNNFFTSNPNSRQKYETNLKMIKFHDIDNDDSNFNFWPGIPDWETVKEKFTEYNFSSIINDKSWNKFVTTFKMGA